jgi:glycine cleavage system H protein
MNPYSYYNIFETKGIEYLVVIGFLLLLIPFWRWLNRPLERRVSAGEALEVLTSQLLRIPKGLLYNLNHTWVHLEKGGWATVGADDLLLHLTGGVEVRFLKEQQEKIEKGEPLAALVQDGKQLLITSPITGTVLENHHALSKDPDLLLEDPYRSWLYKIKPDKWQQETSAFRMGEEAVQWNRDELDRFTDFIGETSEISNPDFQVVLQAGGELIDHPLREMGQEVWNRFQEMFLDTES